MGTDNYKDQILPYMCNVSLSARFFTLTLTEIVVSPMNTTVYLDQTAEFICEYRDTQYIPVWEMDGVETADLPFELQNEIEFFHAGIVGSRERSGLRVPARLEFNETMIQCYILADNNVRIRSNTATLLIQGRDLFSFIAIYKLYSN